MHIHSHFLITLLMHLLSVFFSSTSFQYYSHAPLHSNLFTFHQHAPHAPPLIILLMHLSIACIFIHISSARSSCTSSQFSCHAPLHIMPIHSHFLTSRSSRTSSQYSSHAPLHSMPIHSHFLSKLLMHLLSVFFSCTSP